MEKMSYVDAFLFLTNEKKMSMADLDTIGMKNTIHLAELASEKRTRKKKVMRMYHEILMKMIVKRAIALELVEGDKSILRACTCIDIAHEISELRLEDFLNADDFNFAHDFMGIQRHLNLETKEFDNFFVPRFATK